MADEGAEILVTKLPRLRPRAADSNKGTYGKVLVVAGSRGMSGAAILAGTAALRSGAGLVQVAVPEVIADIVASGQPCYMAAALPSDANGRLSCKAAQEIALLRKSADVVVVGPGLGQNDDIAGLVRGIVTSDAHPVVIDADALNAIAATTGFFAAGPYGDIVMTPHPGEFARLTKLDTKAVQSQRRELAIRYAREHGVVLVLKGAGTIVTDGRRVYINTTGNPGMATGGTGDVLSGILGALIAQGLDMFDAAVLGVHVHGLAGDFARDHVGEVSLIATDLLVYLPEAFRAVS